MEFIVVVSRHIKQPHREKAVIEAVVEAAEDLGVSHIEVRRGNAYSPAVYLRDVEGESLIYTDWDKDWDSRRIYRDIVSSHRFPLDSTVQLQAD